VGHGINGGDEDGNPTQYRQDTRLGGGPASARVRVRVRYRNRFSAAGDIDVGKCGVE
jgi:hypothetical protein